MRRGALHAIVAVLWLLPAFGGAAEVVKDSTSPQSLDQLLKQVLDSHQREAQSNQQREQRFTAAREQQQSLVEAARAALAAEQARGDHLRQSFGEQREAVAKARLALEESAGDIDQLRGVLRQVAGEVGASVHGSLISAQFPGREPRLAQIAANPRLPAAGDLEEVWRVLLGEAVASGKVERFEAAVVNADGADQRRRVMRIGGFTLVSDDEFLRYLPHSAQLQAPPRQPDASLRRLAARVTDSQGKVTWVPIDPSRGALLGMLAQRPNLLERLAQAGVVGYVIVILGLVGLALALERLRHLLNTRKKVAAQLLNTVPSNDNPLGRLRVAAESALHADAEALGLKLDETILAELPALRSRLPALAVLATAAPLLGLLGTVAGMIQTFQSMSLFGAGDPKVVSGGISLALVATELGLLVAIPMLLMHAGLHGMSNRLIHVLEHAAAALVAEREMRRVDSRDD